MSSLRIDKDAIHFFYIRNVSAPNRNRGRSPNRGEDDTGQRSRLYASRPQLDATQRTGSDAGGEHKGHHREPK